MERLWRVLGRVAIVTGILGLLLWALTLLLENHRLRSELVQIRREHSAVPMHVVPAPPGRLLPGAEEWERRHNLHFTRFLVTDQEDRFLARVKVSAIPDGDQAITNEVGLTSLFCMALGNKVLVEKKGFEPKEVVLNRDNTDKRQIYIQLRRINDDSN